MNTSDPVGLTQREVVEFGTLSVGTWFAIDSNGVTFQKTSDRAAKIVDGHVGLLGIEYQFGLSKLVCVVPRDASLG